MSAGAPQEDVLGEGESACDEVLQPQQGREEAGEQEEDDGVVVEEEEEEEEAPTHLPFAPSSEVRAPLFLSCSGPSAMEARVPAREGIPSSSW